MYYGFQCVQCARTSSTNVAATSARLFTCRYHTDETYVYCSRACQFRHALHLREMARQHYQIGDDQSIGAEKSDTVVFKPTQLTTERVEELILLLNDTENKEKVREATDKFMSWFRLPRVPVFFFHNR